VALAQKAPGVERMLVDRTDWTVTIWYDANVTDATRIQQAVEAAARAVEESEER
jgi:hypothetical protein